MTDRPEKRRPKLPAAVELRLWMAKVALFWERIWPAIWPGLGVISIFLVLAFLEVWRLVPLAVQALCVFALLIGAAFLIWRNVTRMRLPGHDEGLRRLEKESGLKHRPLTSFNDKPVARDRDPAAYALWAAHKRNLADRMRKVGVVWPKPKTSDRDPYAFRLLLILILGVSVLVAGPDWGNRLVKAVAPFLAQHSMAVPEVNAWIQPPEYTGKPSVYLTSAGPRVTPENNGETGTKDAPTEIEVPEGAKLVVQLTGAGANPILRLSPLENGGKSLSRPAFVVEDGIRKAELVLEESLNLKILQNGDSLGSWRITVQPDSAPEISFLSRPTATAMASLSLNYRVEDDYGVTEAKAHIALAAKDGEKTTKPLTLDLPLPAPRPGPVDEIAIENLAAHRWAGREVEIHLTVVDSSGQTGASEPLKTTLPQRVFTDPLARALIEQRAALEGGPSAAPSVAAALNSLSAAPERFIKDVTVYLGMRAGYWRLTHDPIPEAVEEVHNLLWELALRVEDGGVSASLERLRRIQEALMKALAEGAPPAEIAQLLAQQRAALEQYMAELMQNAEAMPAASEDAPEVQVRDLGKMLEDLRRMTEVGAHDQARQLLAQLGQLLENLRPSGAAGGGQGQAGSPPSPQEKALQKAVHDLSDIVSRQRGLLDDTFRAAGPENFAPPPPDPLGDLEALFKRSDVMKRRGPLGGPDNVIDDLANEPYFEQLLGNLLARRSAPPPPANGASPDQKQPPAKSNGQAFKPPADARASTDLARDQRRLKGDLASVLETMTAAGVQSPPTLGEAETSMGESGMALGDKKLVDAYGHQQDALAKLRSSAEQLGEQLHQMQKARRGQSGGPQAQQRGQPQGGEDGSDPLGRRRNGQTGNGEGIKLPSESAVDKARRVLDELRRRASERDRPKVELEYLERLLQRF